MGTGSVTHHRIIQEPKAMTAAASFEKKVPGKRKAAMLLMALGKEASVSVFKNLNEEREAMKKHLNQSESARVDLQKFLSETSAKTKQELGKMS
jgi:flagellar motor switch protein FliG